LRVCLAGCSELGEVAGKGIQDLICGLGPGERAGVVVPGGDPALMSFSRACTEVCAPRRISLSVSRPNHLSTWFIYDEPA